jgi:hypothetical protein
LNSTQAAIPTAVGTVAATKTTLVGLAVMTSSDLLAAFDFALDDPNETETPSYLSPPHDLTARAAVGR